MDPTIATTLRKRPRPERRVSRKIVALDLHAEAKALRREDTWRDHGHDAKMLSRREHERSILVVLRAGKKIPKHDADASVLLEPIEGRIRVHLPDDIVELGPGTLLSLDSHVPYDIEAKNADVAFLVTWCPCGACP